MKVTIIRIIISVQLVHFYQKDLIKGQEDLEIRERVKTIHY